MENTIRYFPGIVQTRAMGAALPDETDDKYWIRVLASNAETDMHNSIMDPLTTLPNYEQDAKTKPGVAHQRPSRVQVVRIRTLRERGPHPGQRALYRLLYPQGYGIRCGVP